jgi:hypothetical protein
MSNGRYSDDPREDSLFRDDEMRLMEELENETNEQPANNSKAGLYGTLFIIGLMVLFFWWFFWG